jgi:hypothetical protein
MFGTASALAPAPSAYGDRHAPDAMHDIRSIRELPVWTVLLGLTCIKLSSTPFIAVWMVRCTGRISRGGDNNTTPSPYTHVILHNANSPFFAHLHGGLFAAKSMHKSHSNHVPR